MRRERHADFPGGQGRRRARRRRRRFFFLPAPFVVSAPKPAFGGRSAIPVGTTGAARAPPAPPAPQGRSAVSPPPPPRPADACGGMEGPGVDRPAAAQRQAGAHARIRRTPPWRPPHPTGRGLLRSVATARLERRAAYPTLDRACARAVGPLLSIGVAPVPAPLARLRAVPDDAAGYREQLAALCTTRTASAVRLIAVTDPSAASHLAVRLISPTPSPCSRRPSLHARLCASFII